MPLTCEPIKVPDSGRTQHLHVVAGARSIQGARREVNEDSNYISPDLNLFIVADGMGGHADGEIASRFAVDVLAHELARFTVESTEEEVSNRVHAALDRANCLILAAGEAKSRTPGTTVVLGLLVNHRLYITGVGDSRAYLIRGGAIERLTVDDTWPDVMFHLGQISADEAKRHHMRNMLLSSLGMKEFDSAKEEIKALDVYNGDRFLLTSDGLTDVVNEDALLQIILQADNPQTAAESLVREAISNDAGDDVTCVLFYVQSDQNQATAKSPIPTIWRRLTTLFKPR